MPYLGNTTTSFNVDSNNINNGSITTEKIAAGAVVNADVNDSASIAGTKISADFGAQDLIVDTNLLFVDVSTDRVGIGTSSPVSRLDLSGGADGTLGAITFAQGNATNKVAQVIGTSSNTNEKGIAINTYHYADVNAVRITSDGKVGVGTTSPARPLDVVSDSGARAIQVRGRSSDNIGLIDFYSNDGATRYATIGAPAASQFAIETGNTEKLRIDSSGRVGIGTSSPDNLLEVDAGTGSDAGITIRMGTANSGANDSHISFQNSAGSQIFRAEFDNSTPKFKIFSDQAADAFTILRAGNVGIGTTSPGRPLQVAMSSAAATVASLVNSGTGPAQLGFQTSALINDAQVRVGAEGSNFVIYTNNSRSVDVDSSGRLLVGTSSSSAATRLVVQGNSSSSSGTGSIYLRRGNDAIGSGVNLGEIVFSNNANQTGAWIQSTSDAAWTLGSSHPTRINFATTAASSTSPTERLHIASTGAFGLSGANYGTSGQVLTSQGSGSAPQWATPAVGFVDYGGADPNGTSIINITGISLDCRLLKIYIMHFSSSNTNSPQISLRLGNGSVSSASYTGRVFEDNTNTSEATGSDRINITHTGHTSNSHVWTGIIDVGMSVSSGCAVSWNIFSELNHGEFGAARWNGNNRIDRIQLIGSAGNWDGGYVRVFGDR